MDEKINVGGALPQENQPVTEQIANGEQPPLSKSGVTYPNEPDCVVCSNCGAVNVAGSKFCSECGSPVSTGKFCYACGARNAADAKFCNACGANLQTAASAVPAAPAAPVVPAAPAAPEEQPQPPELQGTYESKYTGGALTRLFINIGVVLLSLITLGIAYPFLLCAQEKWLKSHTFVNGRQLEFDGNGAQIIGKFILWLLLSLITFGLYAIFRLPLNMQRWKTKHTHVRGYRIGGKKGESKFTGSIFGLWGVRILEAIMMVFGIITLGFASAWGTLVKLRWFNEKKIIDGVKITNDAKVGQFWVKRLGWNILMVVTLGIHTIFVRANSQMKFLASHDKFTNPTIFPRPAELARTGAPAAGAGTAAGSPDVGATSGAGGAVVAPAVYSTENTNKAIVFIVLSFVLPIPLLFPILANVFANKAKKAGEPNGKGAAIAARVILALQLIGYIVVAVIYGVIFSRIFEYNDPSGENNERFTYEQAQMLEIGMTQSQVRSYMGHYGYGSGLHGETESWVYFTNGDELKVTFDNDYEVVKIEYMVGGAISGYIDPYESSASSITGVYDDMLIFEYYVEYTDNSWEKGVAEAEYTDISVEDFSGYQNSWRFDVEWELNVEDTKIKSSTFGGKMNQIASNFNNNFAERVLYLYDMYYAEDELRYESEVKKEQYDALLSEYGLVSSWR